MKDLLCRLLALAMCVSPFSAAVPAGDTGDPAAPAPGDGVYSVSAEETVSLREAFSAMAESVCAMALSLTEEPGGGEDGEEHAEDCRSGLTEEKYERAEALFEAGENEAARALFEELAPYGESELYLRRIAWRGCGIGDTVFFGSYPMGPEGECESISWTVLDEKDGMLLLLCDRGLEPLAYAPECYPFWANSPIRDWLNGEFRERAFSEEERAFVAELTVETPDFVSELGRYLGGPDSRDRVFLLSLGELTRYFPDAASRLCQPTAYALSRGARASRRGFCPWWSRSPGNHGGQISCVREDGEIIVTAQAWDRNVCVRPALWLVP